MSSISWFHDSKQFMSSHNNGSLIIWNCKNDAKPANILIPHSKFLKRIGICLLLTFIKNIYFVF